MTADSEPQAVITGDIVKSGNLAAAEFAAAMEALEATSRAVAGWPAISRLEYERFRGDGWQLVIAPARYALRAALVMRAGLRGAVAASETRLAIGIGAASHGPRPGASSGPAFERSGQALDGLAHHRHWAFGGTLANAALDRLADGLIGLADDRSQAWTARQAAIVYRLLAPTPPAMTELARSLDIQPQTVQRHFARAGGHVLQEAAEIFEAVVDEIARTAIIG